MSEQLPKFLAVHFDGDCLEHAAFVNTEKEASQLTCLVAPGDHWSPVLIPIETAVAAPDLLDACKMCFTACYMNTGDFLNQKSLGKLAAAIEKAKPKE